ncbi:MAG: hypothetical protein V1770_01505, partial [bacterium]
WTEKKHTEHFGIGKDTGFRVLTTTISEARAENLRRAVKEASGGKMGNNMFYFTCAKNIDFANPESILKPIWRTPAGDEYRSIG